MKLIKNPFDIEKELNLKHVHRKSNLYHNERGLPVIKARGKTMREIYKEEKGYAKV